jgi:hypothetical protein
VLCEHMRHLVAQHGRQLRGVAGERDQAACDIELAGRQCESVYRAGIELEIMQTALMTLAKSPPGTTVGG